MTLKDIINPDLDVKAIREEYITKRVVVIEDFLKEEYAERVHNYLTEEMPRDWWRVSTHPKVDGTEGFDSVIFSPEHEEDIKKNYSVATEAFGKGNFAYCFHRTVDDHQSTCSCFECELRQWLLGEESISFINEVIDSTVTTTDEVFAAVYLPGDFLSPHVDSPNGTTGFIYQLTKDWLPQYGGNLHFMNHDTMDVERVEVPQFNTLTLFDLPKGVGKWHYVSHVNPGVEQLRLTYTGWFK